MVLSYENLWLDATSNLISVRENEYLSIQRHPMVSKLPKRLCNIVQGTKYKLPVHNKKEMVSYRGEIWSSLKELLQALVHDMADT